MRDILNNLLRSVTFWVTLVVIILPLFFPEDVFATLSLAAIYAISSLGLSLLLGNAGQISMGQAGFMGIGGYTTALLTTRFDMPVVIAFMAAVAVTSFIAFVIGKPILKTKGFFLALATLGFGQIFFVFVNRTEPVLGGIMGISGIPYFSIAGYEFADYVPMYYLCWAILICLIIFSRNIVAAKAGRALTAISTDEIAASAMGIDVAKYKLKAFVLCAAYAGISGSLLATYLSLVQPFGFQVTLSIYIVLTVIVGGMGNLWGVVFATVFLTWLRDEQLSHYAEYSTLIYGVILILILIFFPKGLGSIGERVIRMFKHR